MVYEMAVLGQDPDPGVLLAQYEVTLTVQPQAYVVFVLEHMMSLGEGIVKIKYA